MQIAKVYEVAHCRNCRTNRHVITIHGTCIKVNITIAVIFKILFLHIICHVIIPWTFKVSNRLVIIRTLEHGKVWIYCIIIAPAFLIHLTATKGHQALVMRRSLALFLDEEQEYILLHRTSCL